MSEQLQSDFDKLVKTSKFSNEEIKFKKNFLNNFIKNGFPNRKQEDWKFLDISQIIKKNISDLSFFNDYSQSNKIDPSILVDGLEDTKEYEISLIDFNGTQIPVNVTRQNEQVKILPKNILTSGLYYVQLKSENSIFTLKTVKYSE